MRRALCLCLSLSALLIGCASDQERAEVAFQAAAPLFERGDSAGAIAKLEEAVRLDPSLHRAWARLAEARLDEPASEDALPAAVHAAELQPENAGYQVLLARAQRAHQEHGRARDAYRRALELDGEQHPLRYELARELEENQELEPAIEAYRDALAHHVREPEARVALGRILLARERPAEAREALAPLANAARLAAPLREERDRLLARIAELDPPAPAPGEAGDDPERARHAQNMAALAALGPNGLGVGPAPGTGAFADAVREGAERNSGPPGGGEGLGLRGTGRTGGPPAEPPAAAGLPRVRLSGPSVRGSLSQVVVTRIMARNATALRSCAGRSPQTGEARLRWVISPTGEVASATAEGALPAPVRSCMAERLRATRFPQPEGGGVVAVEQTLTVE